MSRTASRSSFHPTLATSASPTAASDGQPKAFIVCPHIYTCIYVVSPVGLVHVHPTNPDRQSKWMGAGQLLFFELYIMIYGRTLYAHPSTAASHRSAAASSTRRCKPCTTLRAANAW